MTRLLALAAVGLLAVPALAEPPLKNPINGDAKVKSIDVISFGPDGLLLIGDGAGGQVVAVATEDTTNKPWSASPIEKIDQQLAGRIGSPAKGIEILHLAVNPASGTAYFAVRNLDTKQAMILTVDGAGKIGEFTLDKVQHVRIALPKGEKAAPNKITDIAWAGDHVLVAAQASEEFASKLFSIPTPLDAAKPGAIFSTETYHVAHRAWETRAPIQALIPFEEDGKQFVVGSFVCTPVVKFPLSDLQPGSKVKGSSVIELGSGNRPLNMFSYGKGGRTYVLMNAFRFHHAKNPYGASPYVTFRMDTDILGEKDKVNEKAVIRTAAGQPMTERVKLVDDFFGVVHLDRLDKDRALVVKENDKGEKTLTPLTLP